MKKLFLSLLVFTALVAQAQTADDVVQQYGATIGGLDAFNKIQTAKMTGTVTVQGMDLPITVQVINNKAVRSDVEAMGTAVVSSYKDGKGWKINPFGGAADPTDVTGDELAELQTQTMLAPALLDYKARGSQLELQGQEDVDGAKAFKIKLTPKTGDATTYYIKVADYTLIKSIGPKTIQGQTVNVETFYSDLKQSGDVKFYMTRSVKVDGSEVQAIKYDTVTLNGAIDEKAFDKP